MLHEVLNLSPLQVRSIAVSILCGVKETVINEDLAILSEPALISSEIEVRYKDKVYGMNNQAVNGLHNEIYLEIVGQVLKMFGELDPTDNFVYYYNTFKARFRQLFGKTYLEVLHSGKDATPVLLEFIQ